MACSRFEYVKKFENPPVAMLDTYIIIRIDGINKKQQYLIGKGFTKFTEKFKMKKPNDITLLSLMNLSAEKVLETFSEIWLAYGQSDEYSFVFNKNTKLYSRRIEKIVSCVTSCFSSVFSLNFQKFFPDKELTDIPIFDGRLICYPNSKTLRDYLSWRQADCHINNLYNTCFWSLVENGKKTCQEAEKILKVTNSEQKNEILFNDFGINYNKIDQIFRKGTILLRKKIEKIKEKSKEKTKENYDKIEKSNENIIEIKNEKDNDNDNDNDNDKINLDNIEKKVRKKQEILIINEDLISDLFWKKYEILLD